MRQGVRKHLLKAFEPRRFAAPAIHRTLDHVFELIRALFLLRFRNILTLVAK